MSKTKLAALFWLILVLFFAWDWGYSAPAHIRQKPPVIAIASGQAPSGAHCASTF